MAFENEENKRNDLNKSLVRKIKNKRKREIYWLNERGEEREWERESEKKEKNETKGRKLIYWLNERGKERD